VNGADLLDALAELVAAKVAAKLRQDGEHAGASRLVSRNELLEHLSISSPTLRKLETKNAIPFVQVGDLRRYDIDAVRAALANVPPTSTETSNVVRLSRGRR